MNVTFTPISSLSTDLDDPTATAYSSIGIVSSGNPAYNSTPLETPKHATDALPVIELLSGSSVLCRSDHQS